MPKHERTPTDDTDPVNRPYVDLYNPTLDKRAKTHTTEEYTTKITYAIKMQRYRTRKLATDAINFGMTCNIAKALPFDDLVSQINDISIIKTTKLNFQRICVLIAASNPAQTDLCTHVKIRVFLVAYLIAYRSTDVFQRITKLEVDLQKAAIDMLKVYEDMCTEITQSERGSCLSETVEKYRVFQVVVDTYVTAFDAWRSIDAVILVDRIKHTLSALYEALDHLIDGDTDTPQLRIKFGSEQTRLRSQLLQIAGQAALDSVDELRKSKGLTCTYETIEFASATSSNPVEGGYTSHPKRMSNELLAHELLLDPQFKLDEHSGENPVYKKIRHSFEVCPITTPEP